MKESWNDYKTLVVMPLRKLPLESQTSFSISHLSVETARHRFQWHSVSYPSEHEPSMPTYELNELFVITESINVCNQE